MQEQSGDDKQKRIEEIASQTFSSGDGTEDNPYKPHRPRKEYGDVTIDDCFKTIFKILSDPYGQKATAAFTFNGSVYAVSISPEDKKSK